MMSQQTIKQSKKGEGVILSPKPQLALIIFFLGLLLIPLPFHPWPSLVISGFGLALLAQTITLRLEFTNESMIVWQLNRELRRFPFKEWLAWRIFLPWLPGILYFRETQSPHLLPILFNVDDLQQELRLRVGNLEKPIKVNASE